MTDGLRLSRRHAAGSPSARGLLFTVLGEFVLPNGSTAWTSALIDAISRLGVEEKNVRQALMRTAADGWLASERVGRRTRWRLTPAAEELLTEGTERIYGFTGTAAGWDGQWLLALARVPETDRPARHKLRTRMTWAGFGSPEPGVWISPHTGRVDEVARILTEAGVTDARVFVASQVPRRNEAGARQARSANEAGARQARSANEAGARQARSANEAGAGQARSADEAEPRRGEAGAGREDAGMAGQAWDLDGLEEDYETFLDDFSGAETDDPIADLTGLVHAWRRFPWVDPVLPVELLPQPWRGTQAAELFHKRHDQWSAGAQEAWAAINL
jgi:phenylacetic acid degradation operon negative regulatory protein